MAIDRTQRASGGQLAQITVDLVKLHREYFGKGPTEAKSYAIDHTIICILKGGFTTVEETLLAAGQWEDVERVRRAFQDAMKDRFTAVVEGAIERRVIGYMNQINADPQVAVEIFLLEPSDEKLLAEHEIRFDDEE